MATAQAPQLPVALVPASPLHGRIRDEQGRPLANVPVRQLPKQKGS